MKMIAEIIPMRRDVVSPIFQFILSNLSSEPIISKQNILPVLRESSRVLTTNVFQNLKSVMELTIAKTRRHQMKVIQFVRTTGRVREITSNVKILIFVSNPIGSAVRLE